MGSSLHLNTPAACGEHGTMFVALELGKAQWKLGIVVPGKARLSRYVIDGGDTEAAWQLIAKARARAEKQLGGPVRVMSCYEAGYDGFWLHRWLLARGVDNQVIDPASLQGNRRKRRAKTDPLDLEQLIGALIRLLWGDRLACKVVHVPSPAQEDDRRAWRERERLVKERTAHTNRIKGLLHGQGVRDAMPLKPGFIAGLEGLRTGDGRPLPPELAAEIVREHERLRLVVKQQAELEAKSTAERRAAQ